MAIEDSNTVQEITFRATKPNELTRELIKLDFTYYDVIEELEKLRDLAVSGQINGLVFAARYANPGQRRNLFGASGRYQENMDEALGVATQLQLYIAKHAA